jgi:hypothetical protein
MAHPYWSLGRLPKTRPLFKERIKVSEMLKGPKRLEGESFEDYQIRRSAEKTLLKDYLSGVMVEDKNRPTFEVHKNPEKVYEK